ncbi:apolipoprotein N-acyltransferase [Cognatiyoonia koreensis]|uniref:Apolipoprotein N-acyltransferase n=1 Tax=Cognatiyoonia koreensis TaxID=364200 RepID=A0A1I0RAH1_9RHOB|nr:apolipoprotein N-acyltransferase [Cognatiyoonia koreensis]SEW37781.1 apolipoprotein N-acyltransferase [Cognatiyoonia koreensis]
MADTRVAFWAAAWWVRAIGLIGLGAVAGLGQAPIDWPLATVLALAILFWLLRTIPEDLRVWRAMWLFGLGYFAFTLRWIVEPFLVDVQTHGWMAPFALLAMAAGGGAFWSLAGGLAQHFAPRRPLVLGLSIAAAEVTRSLILSGFPWALLGHIWIDTSLAQIAAVGGPHLLTLITVLAAISLAHLTARHWDALIVPAMLVGLAFWLDPGPPPAPTALQKTVRLVQPNIPQNEKWDIARRDYHFERLLGYTSAGNVRPHLIVWPESSVTDLLEWAQPMLDQMSEAAEGVPLLAGVQRRSKDRIYHNSLFVLGRGGLIEGLYDKKHLVPFGEFIPGGELVGTLGLPGFASSQGFGFTAGTLGETINVPGVGIIRPLICYEGIFAEEITTDIRPKLMVLITNDAWFGAGPGPYQHLAQARLRAIEQGLPMVRVANTGVSAVIDARGRITARMELGEEGYLDAALPAAAISTPYVRFGDTPAIVAIFGLLALLFLRGRRVSD